jgi:deoxyribodipyrimidine photo-lyase
VFTPFWRAARMLGDAPEPLGRPRKLQTGEPPASPKPLTLDSLRLLPTKPDWAAGLRDAWTPGEAGARKALMHFTANRLRGYSAHRDRPDLTATSHLSPHLRFGEISPRQVWHAAQRAAHDGAAPHADAEKFLSEIGWREFSYHLLFHNRDLATANFDSRFDAFPWLQDKTELRAWQRGRTGIPIVDAGMRELWHTGAMHNRVRMVVASFLVKHLLIDWRAGEQWFWDTLVDADAGSNPANWQWVAGSGADAAPYFRVFNPILQGEKFDPDGVYVRRWVPELQQLPDSLIHQPWSATPLELASAGIELGKTYPRPIVDHKVGRERALTAYASIRNG